MFVYAHSRAHARPRAGTCKSGPLRPRSVGPGRAGYPRTGHSEAAVPLPRCLPPLPPPTHAHPSLRACLRAWQANRGLPLAARPRTEPARAGRGPV